MRKFAYALAGLIAAAGMTLAGAGAASASTALVHSSIANGVSTATITTGDEAGYLAFPNIGESSFKQIQSTMYLRLAAEQIGSDANATDQVGTQNAQCAAVPSPTNCEFPFSYLPVASGEPTFGAMGLEACNDTETVQAGFILNANGTFDVVDAYGLSTVTNTHCADDGLLTTLAPGSEIHILAVNVPDGSAYALLIKRGEHAFGHVRIEAQNLTNGTTVASDWIPWVHSFAEVGAGVQADPHLMTTSLDNELLAVRHTNITSLAGVTSDFGGTPDWTADQVVGSNSGSVFLSPLSSLSGATFKVWGGQPVV